MDIDPLKTAVHRYDELRNKEMFDNIGKDEAAKTFYSSEFLVLEVLKAFQGAELDVQGGDDVSK